MHLLPTILRIALVIFVTAAILVSLSILAGITPSYIANSTYDDSLCDEGICWLELDMVEKSFSHFSEMFNTPKFRLTEDRSSRLNMKYIRVYSGFEPEEQIALITLRNDNDLIIFVDLYFDGNLCVQEVLLSYGPSSKIREQGNALVYLYDDDNMLIYADRANPQAVNQIHFTRPENFTEFEVNATLPNWSSIPLRGCKER